MFSVPVVCSSFFFYKSNLSYLLGCSFLKFTQRSAALNAINAMHNSRIMEVSLFFYLADCSNALYHPLNYTEKSNYRMYCHLVDIIYPPSFYTYSVFLLSALSSLTFSFLQGASSPLVVKFADTEKDKMMRRMNSSVGLVYAGFPAMGSVNQYAMYQQVSTSPDF